VVNVLLPPSNCSWPYSLHPSRTGESRPESQLTGRKVTASNCYANLAGGDCRKNTMDTHSIESDNHQIEIQNSNPIEAKHEIMTAIKWSTSSTPAHEMEIVNAIIWSQLLANRVGQRLNCTTFTFPAAFPGKPGKNKLIFSLCHAAFCCCLSWSFLVAPVGRKTKTSCRCRRQGTWLFTLHLTRTANA